MAISKIQPTVQSRKNGLIIAIPHEAKNVISRFKTPGDNELVFADIRGKHAVDNDVAKVESTAPGRKANTGPKIEDLA